MNMSQTSSILLVVIWIGLGIALRRLASKSRHTNPVTYTAKTKLSDDVVEELIENNIPQIIIPGFLGWKSSYPTEDTLLLTGYYLSAWEILGVLLLTGIALGIWLIWLMGRSEKINVDYSKLQNTGEVILEASGLRAQQATKKIVDKINLEST